MDEGDMLATAETVIADDDTTGSLTTKLSCLAAEQLTSIIEDYVNGKLLPQPQPSPASYTQPLAVEDGHIDLEAPPVDLERRIRAMAPWPGVWGMWHNKRVKLLPGGMVQLEGRRATALTDFLHGYPDFPIKNLS
jgi:methionyl-tRNA formyltransferase